MKGKMMKGNRRYDNTDSFARKNILGTSAKVE